MSSYADPLDHGFGRVKKPSRGILRAFLLFCAERSAVGKLERLSDHTLADIGLERDRIREVVHQNLSCR